MTKKVIIVHGWDGNPGEGWYPWLKGELEKRGFEVAVPQMPNPEEPRIGSWIPALRGVAGIPNENTFFVGHSMGCQAIARYLESMPQGAKAGGVVFVAGFFKSLANLEDDATVRRVADEWLKTPLNLEKVKQHMERSVAIFSDDDPYVPLENQNDFKDKLGAKIVLEHGKRHFSGSDGMLELPVVLDSLLEMSQ